MPKWGIFNASLLLDEHGHPFFYFKIEVIIWQIFSGQSLNKNLLSLLFQRNYLKLQMYILQRILVAVITGERVIDLTLFRENVS